MLESELERRFVAALRKYFQVTKRLIGGGKTGYLIFSHDGAIRWELEPQVEFGREQGVEVVTRADFVLRPYQEQARNKHNQLVIYTDGYEYHRDIVGEDVIKRLALMRAGYQVLSLTWHDVPEPGVPFEKVTSEFKGSETVQGLLANPQTPFQDFIQQHQRKFNTITFSEAHTHALQGPYALLAHWINDAKATREKLCQVAVLAALVAMIPPNELMPVATAAAEKEIELADYLAHQSVQAASPELLCQVSSFVRREELRQMMALFPPLNTLLLFDNRQLSEQTNSPFAKSWRDFWLTANVLQFGTRLHLGLYEDVLAGRWLEAPSALNVERELDTGAEPAWG